MTIYCTFHADFRGWKVLRKNAVSPGGAEQEKERRPWLIPSTGGAVLAPGNERITTKTLAEHEEVPAKRV